MALALDPSRSTPAYIWLYTKPSLYLKQPTIKLKPAVEDLQVMVYKRMADHVGNKIIFNALSDLDWLIRKICKKPYRYDLLELLATIPLPDLLELNYLLSTKTFFKHYNKFDIVYKALKIKNIKNRHRSNIDPNLNTELLHKTKMLVNIAHATMKTSTSSNFLLDFGFVESVGSVLP